MRWARGIKGRTTLVATGVVALVLAVGGFALVGVVRTNLVSNLDLVLQQQADDRSLLISSGANPTDLLDPGNREAFVLVQTEGGTLGPDVNWVPCDDYPCQVEVNLTENGETEPHVVRQVKSSFAGGTVYIAAELEEIDRVISRVSTAVAVGVPIVLLIIGALIWRVVGRVLNPVGEIAEEAAAIHGGALDRRVPTTGNDDEIDHLAESVNKMLDRIDADAQSKRHFASDASHELKSPLANLRIMIDTSDAETWNSLASTATGELDRMAALVDDLLYLSVLDEPGFRPTKESVHIDDLLFDEISVARAATTKMLDAGSVQPITTHGDEDRLRRAIRNLISNAVRHADGEVRIATSSTVDTVRLEIDDDGPGIPAEDRDRVFERFARLDGARARGTGSTGIGLAIVHDVVAVHSGRVWVEESELGGARFVVELPK